MSFGFKCYFIKMHEENHNPHIANGSRCCLCDEHYKAFVVAAVIFVVSVEDCMRHWHTKYKKPAQILKTTMITALILLYSMIT